MIRPFTIFFITILLFLYTAVLSQTNNKRIVAANVKTMYGTAFNTSKIDNDGKPMIFVVWHTDRKMCFQYFQALNEEITDWHTETGVKVVIISTDSPKSAPEVLPMVMAKKWDFESYIDTYQEFKIGMGVVGIPYTFIVNGKREVVWERQSYAPGLETEIYEEVKKVVKEDKAGK